jgi:hypothetical protein
MAAPNLKQPVIITGKTATYSCTSSLASALSNGAGSNKVLKVNTIRAANIDATSAFSVDITVYRSAANTYIANAISVPVNSTLVVLSKEEYIYLEEGDAIYAKGSTSGKIDLTISYEEIS